MHSGGARGGYLLQHRLPRRQVHDLDFDWLRPALATRTPIAALATTAAAIAPCAPTERHNATIRVTFDVCSRPYRATTLI